MSGISCATVVLFVPVETAMNTVHLLHCSLTLYCHERLLLRIKKLLCSEDKISTKNLRDDFFARLLIRNFSERNNRSHLLQFFQTSDNFAQSQVCSMQCDTVMMSEYSFLLTVAQKERTNRFHGSWCTSIIH